MVPGLAALGKDASVFVGRERQKTSSVLSPIMPEGFVPRVKALRYPFPFPVVRGWSEALPHTREEEHQAQAFRLPSPASSKPAAPPPGAGPTSAQVSRCGQVGKVIQADDVNDGAHHAGVVLGENERWCEARDSVKKGPAACSPGRGALGLPAGHVRSLGA